MWRNVCGETAIGLRRTQRRGSRETGRPLRLPGRIGSIIRTIRVVSGGLYVCGCTWRRLGMGGGTRGHGAERGHARQPVRTRLGSDDGVDSLSSQSQSHLYKRARSGLRLLNNKFHFICTTIYNTQTSNIPARQHRRAVPWLMFFLENLVTNKYQSTPTCMMGPLTVDHIKLVPSRKYQVECSVRNTYALSLDEAVDGGTGESGAEVA